MSGQASALGGCGLVEDLAHLLGVVVGDFDTDMRFICREGCVELFLLTLRVPITRGAQEIADLIEGIACGSTVAQCFLLDAAGWSGLVLWTGCFEGCWLLLAVLCPLARVLVG